MVVLLVGAAAKEVVSEAVLLEPDPEMTAAAAAPMAKAPSPSALAVDPVPDMGRACALGVDMLEDKLIDLLFASSEPADVPV